MFRVDPWEYEGPTMSWTGTTFCSACGGFAVHSPNCPNQPEDRCKVCAEVLRGSERVMCSECKAGAEDAGSGQYDPDEQFEHKRAERIENERRTH